MLQLPSSCCNFFLKSEAEDDIALNSGMNIANMHFKKEAKIHQNKMIQCLKCQKLGNHFSEMSKI